MGIELCFGIGGFGNVSEVKSAAKANRSGGGSQCGVIFTDHKGR